MQLWRYYSSAGSAKELLMNSQGRKYLTDHLRLLNADRGYDDSRSIDSQLENALQILKITPAIPHTRIKRILAF